MTKLKAHWKKLVFGLIYAPFAGWCTLALWFDSSKNSILAGLVVAIFAAGVCAILVKVRPLKKMALVAWLPILAVIVWWKLIPPSNDRDWQPSVSRLPSAEVTGGQFTIKNVRDFKYSSESEFEPRWESRTYDLNEVRGADMFISFWGPTLIAHTIMSWEFSDGRHLAISIETRKEKGEAYSAVKGFFRQFEIYYVVADERDVVGLRTAYRGEQVFLYRLKHSPEMARKLLEDYLVEIDKLDKHPEWYNALSENCTTSIRHHAQAVGAGNSWDWRILANGRLDERGYELGVIDTSMPLAELRKRSNITEKAKAAINDPAFSQLIRVGLPGSH